MSKTRSDLMNQLREMDSKSVPFFEAKNLLKKQGFTDSEISHALYEFSYDGKPNNAKAEDKVKTYYSTNPKEAERIAEYILKNQKRHHYARAGAKYLASQYAPGYHARSYYSLKFADEIGYPFFTVLFSILVFGLISFRYRFLPNEFIYRAIDSNTVLADKADAKRHLVVIN